MSYCRASRSLVFGLLLVAMITAGGCKSTYRQDIYIHNATDEPMLWNTGMDPSPDRAGRLEAGALARAPIPVPFSEESLQKRSLKVLAWDLSKRLIYCQDQQLTAIRENDWQVEISAGTIECGP